MDLDTDFFLRSFSLCLTEKRVRLPGSPLHVFPSGTTMQCLFLHITYYTLFRTENDHCCHLTENDVNELCECTSLWHTQDHTTTFAPQKKNDTPCLVQVDTLGAAYRTVLLAVHCCVPLQDCGTGKRNRIWLEHHLLANPSSWVLVAPGHKASLFCVKDQAGPRMAVTYELGNYLCSPSSTQSTAMRA